MGIVEEIQMENEKQTFEFRPKLIPALQLEEGAGKKSDIVYEKSDSGNTRRVEGTASAAKQEMHVVDERAIEKSEKMGSCNTEALRMKLWEILGVAPEDKRISNSSSADDSSKHSNIDPKDKSQMAEAAKHKNSDTIEDDTESPDQTKKRPLGRSLTGKKAATRTVPILQHDVNGRRKLLSSPSIVMKLKCQKNIFSFHEREGRGGSSERAIKGQSSSFNKKKTRRKKAGFDPQKKLFPQLSHPEKPLQTNDKQQIFKAAYKATSGSKNPGDPSCRPCQSKDFSRTYETRKSTQPLQKSNEVLKDNQASHVDARENVDTKEIHENADNMSLKAIPSPFKGLKSPSVARDGNSQTKPISPPRTRSTDRVDGFQSPMSPKGKMSSFEGLKIPLVPRNDNSQMMRTSPPPWMRNADPVDDLQSPTLAMDETPPLSTSKTPDNEPFNSGQARPKIYGRRLFSSKSSDDSRQSDRSDMHTESSDNSGETVGHAAEEKETERQLSVSPTEGANVGANKGCMILLLDCVMHHASCIILCDGD
ncbi:putative meiosis-specific protein ASY3 [Dioscorea sansibarensis]